VVSFVSFVKASHVARMSLDASLDLLRRLPPSKVSHNLSLLQSLLPESVTIDLLQSIDQPLITRTCSSTGRQYLLCDYNRDGDSYRSPWSGEWDPRIDDPVVMDPQVRDLEVKANEAFDSYRELYSQPRRGVERRYYEGGVSSVYMWDLDDGIAGVVLFKKSTSYINGVLIAASNDAGWDSVHVFEAVDHTRSAAYKLTSTVMLHMTTSSPTLGSMTLSGNLTRQVPLDTSTANSGGAGTSPGVTCFTYP
jgi:F-actin-capping protein subunit beta